MDNLDNLSISSSHDSEETERKEKKRGRPRAEEPMKFISSSEDAKEKIIRIEKLESDVKKIKEMLHKMSSALGLPKSVLPPLD